MVASSNKAGWVETRTALAIAVCASVSGGRLIDGWNYCMSLLFFPEDLKISRLEGHRFRGGKYQQSQCVGKFSVSEGKPGHIPFRHHCCCTASLSYLVLAIYFEWKYNVAFCVSSSLSDFRLK